MLIGSVFGSGGVVALINYFINKKKQRVETTDSAVETIKKIEEISSKRYLETSKKLEEMELVLATIKQELELEKIYIRFLMDFIRNNGLEVPDRPKQTCEH